MTNPYRAMCAGYEPGDGSMDGAQLVDGEWWHPMFGCDSPQMVVDRARALLAQPEPEGATAKELRQIFDDQSGYIGDEQVMWSSDFVAAARALLARWGRPTPQPPADGEVAELAAELRHFVAGYQQMRGLDPEHVYSIHRGDAMEAHLRISRLFRIAELLERPTPQPVAVAERQPGPEHCDKWGQCWTTDYDPNLVYPPVWQMTELPRRNLGHDFSNAYFWRNVRFWLPANALPTPEAKP